MKSWAGPSYRKEPRSRTDAPALNLFNTASGRVEPLEVKEFYRMYVCGITPYDATHLGHASTYISFDLINRYLRFSGATVAFVENITDIDDPLLERALRVEAMGQIIESILLLQKADSLYAVEGDLYFRVRRDPEFLERSHISLNTALEIFSQRGGDPQRVGKEDPLDALVWRMQRPGEPGWPSPFGVGRPGWHIECSAIALDFLNPSPRDEYAIDIQGGGSDLIFPHHDMSAAQGLIATDQKFARSFAHTGMIGLDGEKMSKSLGNLVFVSRLLSDGTDPMAIRLALMGHHYRSDHMWTAPEITRAEKLVDRLRLNLSRVEVAPTSPVMTEVLVAMSQDLNTEGVIALLVTWCERTESGESGGSAGELARFLDELLGLAF